MKYAVRIAFTILLFSVNLVSSQDELQLTSKDSIVKSAWVFGIGFNGIDDSGDMFDQLFDFDNEWNIVPFPSRLNIGKNFASGIGVEAIASYNKYKVGKQIDGVVLAGADIDYYALDARVIYALNKIWGGSRWFDPYLGGGLGYTDANNQGRGTYNGIVGFKVWFSDRFGLDFNSTGKWAINRDKATNHLQHAVSGLYRFGIKKGLSKKGEQKLAMIQELEKEQQRVQDSISAANKAKEAAALAERLAQEKENARLAAIEQAKLEAENKRKQHIDNSIKKLGLVYYKLNSSYLNTKSRTVLDALAEILKETPSVHLKLKSHTDSRGAATYNKWLSERRVKRTKEYLISKGIAEQRLAVAAYGEDDLLNECDDATYCSEDKHKVNRRSEFEVTVY